MPGGPVACHSAERAPARRVPVPEDFPFECREHGEQAGHGPARWRGQIQRLGQRHETDTEMLQFLKRRQKVRHGAAPTVEAPNQHNIDFAASRRLQQLLPKLSLGCTAADLLHLQRDSPGPPSGVFPQGADLQGDGLLVAGGDAGVEADAEHFRRFPCLAKNPTRFCFLRCRFGGHFSVSLLPDRILSFSAIQDSSYARWLQRLAVVPRHPGCRVGCQFLGVPLQFGQIVERVGAA